MPVLGTMTPSAQTLTFTGVATNAQTVTVAGKAYTTQTTLTDTDGNVLIGANQTATCVNLAAAINLASGAGTLYATSTVVNPHCIAVASGATVVVTAKVAGLAGDFITVSETQTNASWGAATLASGAGNVATALNTIIDKAQLNSDVIAAFRAILGSAFVEAS